MLTLERDATVSAPGRRVRPVDARVSGLSIAHQNRVAAQWGAVFSRLRGLLANHEDLVADGLRPPTEESVTFATLFLASQRRCDPEDIPTMVVPDGEGGVSIEWRTPEDLTRVEFGPDGEPSFMIISAGRVVYQSPSHA